MRQCATECDVDDALHHRIDYTTGMSWRPAACGQQLPLAARSGWMDFFAEAIRHSAEVAIETGRRVTQAFHEDRAQLRAVPRIAGSLLMVQEALQAKPVATVATLRDAAGVTTPTINSLLRDLESRGIIKESTGRARDRVYVY